MAVIWKPEIQHRHCESENVNDSIPRSLYNNIDNAYRP